MSTAMVKGAVEVLATTDDRDEILAGAWAVCAGGWKGSDVRDVAGEIEEKEERDPSTRNYNNRIRWICSESSGVEN